MTTDPGAPKAVLDASAVIAWMFHEQGEETIDKVLRHAVITSVNFAEVVQQAIDRHYERSPYDLRDDLQILGLGIVEPTAADAVRIGELLHGSGRRRDQFNGSSLSLGDATCIAVAERLQLPAVTGEHLWIAQRDLFYIEPMLFR